MWESFIDFLFTGSTRGLILLLGIIIIYLLMKIHKSIEVLKGIIDKKNVKK